MYSGQALAPQRTKRRIGLIGKGRRQARPQSRQQSTRFAQPASRALFSGKERAKRISRRIMRFGMAAGLVGMLGAGIQNAYSGLQGSDLFLLADITVVGNRLLTREEIIARTGLTEGGNLFDADLEAATDSLAAHPMIREALLLRQPPASLVISLEEREPVALVAHSDGICGLDTEGNFIPLPTVPFNLPVVTAMENLATEKGAKIEGLLAHRMVDFLENLKASDPDLWEDVSEVHVDSPKEGRLILVGDGLEVRILFDKPETIARNLKTFLDTRQVTAGIVYVDLRFENQIVVGRTES